MVRVQFISFAQLCPTLCDPMNRSTPDESLSITNSWSSLRFMSIESVMPSSHLILCRPLLLLPRIPPSIRVFSSESTLHMRWPKYWCFSFSIIPSKEIPYIFLMINPEDCYIVKTLGVLSFPRVSINVLCLPCALGQPCFF